jgi:HK97 gp10 family phage protein
MIRLTATGVADVTAALAATAQKVTDDLLRRQLIKAGQPIADRAKSLAPRGPGGGVHLQDEIAVQVVTDDRGQPTVAIGPTTAAFYGSFLELGTIKMAARPFLRPAFDTGTDEATQTVGDGVWREMKP